VALAGLAVVVAAGVLVLWPRADRVTRASFDRIQIGLSRADVEAILGPPGDYRTGLGEVRWSTKSWVPDPAADSPYLRFNWSGNPVDPEDPSRWAVWMSDSVQMCITIDGSGSVVDKVADSRRTTQGPLANLMWRAKRLWHRRFPE
jgi:hypothetical protein